MHAHTRACIVAHRHTHHKAIQGACAGGSCYRTGKPPVFMRNGSVCKYNTILEIHHPAQEDGRHGLLHDGEMTFARYREGESAT